MKFTRHNHRPNPYQVLSEEPGVVMALVAILLIAFFSIVALVIDLSMQQVRVRLLQNAVDAAAYAGTVELDGTRDGWQRAKRAAMLALQTSSLQDAASLASLRLNSGTMDPLEPNGSNYAGTTGEVGNITVSIERGVYWVRDLTNQPRFISLEDPGQFPVRQEFPGQLYMLANTVDVKISLDRATAYFARVFGVKQFAEVTRSARATFDTMGETCVAPIAIPVCQLALDYSPSASQSRLTEEYDSLAQCQRDLVVTEADSLVNRWEGMGRSQFYPLLPRLPNSNVLNQAANYPFLGVLGVPNTDQDAAAEISETEMVEYIINLANNSTRCQKIRLGQRFKPLNRASMVNGQWFDPRIAPANKRPLTRALATLINDSGNPMFSRVFLNPGGQPLPNFPHLRGDTLEDTLFMYGQTTQTSNVGIYYPMGRDKWSNPMCHDSQIPANDLNTARVWQTKAMLIAPQDSQSGTYCPFEAYYTGNGPQGSLPTSVTDPVIVGTVDVYIFDFNVESLADSPPGDANPTYLPGTWSPTNYPAFPYAGLPLNPPDVGNPTCAYTQANCAPVCIRPSLLGCLEWDDRSELYGFPPTKPDLCPGEDISKDDYQRMQLGHPIDITRYPWQTVTTHCLPYRNGNCPPANYSPGDPRCFLRPMPSQVGCGGLRAKISCDKKTFPGVNRQGFEQPTLVPSSDN